MKKFIATNPTLRIALVLACSVIAMATAKANVILNGSFESGPGINGLNVEPILAGSTLITGWTVTRGGIDYEGTNGWNASDGLYSLDLNDGNGPGGIQQTFGTVSGKVYSVTFDMAGNPSVTRIMTMQVQAAGQSGSFSFNTSLTFA